MLSIPSRLSRLSGLQVCALMKAVMGLSVLALRAIHRLSHRGSRGSLPVLSLTRHLRNLPVRQHTSCSKYRKKACYCQIFGKHQGAYIYPRCPQLPSLLWTTIPVFFIGFAMGLSVRLGPRIKCLTSLYRFDPCEYSYYFLGYLR